MLLMVYMFIIEDCWSYYVGHVISLSTHESRRLDWIAAEHARQQGQIGQKLCELFMGQHFPIATASAWGDVSGAVHAALAASQPPGKRQLSVIYQDFNAPNTRDSVNLPHMCAAMASCAKIMGSKRTCVLMALATVAKEDSNIDPIEDEISLIKNLKKAGFGSVLRCRMMLEQPASMVTSAVKADWWQDWLLAFLTENGTEAEGRDGEEGNFWRIGSELARTTIFVEKPTVLGPAELIALTLADRDPSANERRGGLKDRAAQRGFAMPEAAFASLFTKASVGPRGQHVKNWLEENDDVNVVILSPHVGDAAMGGLKFMRDDKQYGRVRLVLVNLKVRNLGQGADFTHQRVSGEVATQWIKRQRVLFDETGDNGRVAVHPKDCPTQPSESELRQVPGAWEAWNGLHNLKLSACSLAGNSFIINPSRLAEFSSAPPCIRDAVQALETEHGEKYANALQYMANANEQPDPRNPDPPTCPGGDEQRGSPPQALVEFENLAALEANCTVRLPRLVVRASLRSDLFSLQVFVFVGKQGIVRFAFRAVSRPFLFYAVGALTASTS